MAIIDTPPASFIPDINLSLSIDGKSIADGGTINISTVAALPVSIGISAIPGGTADWSPSGYDAFDGTENSQTYWHSFYLDFYKGTIFSDATFISGEKMNADGPILKTTSTVTLLGPGTYSAVLYGSPYMRDYLLLCPEIESCYTPSITLDQIRDGLARGPDFGFPPDQFIGVVTFTIQDDPCAAPGACASNVLFIPGIEGSRLYEGTGCGKNAEEKLWEPIGESILKILRGAGDDKVENLFLDSTGKSVCSDIYTKTDDVIDSVGGGNIYKSFIDEMNGLEVDGTINDWKATAYDWRLSLIDLLNNGAERDKKIFYSEATSTPYIEQTLRALAGGSKTGKVTIVAHSNGGFVTKALLNKLGDEEATMLVDKIIMVGAPQSGAPESLGTLLMGHSAGIYKFGFPIVSNAVARELAQNSPMAYHLLPSANYLTSIAGDANHPVARFAGDGYADELSSYGTTIDNNTELDGFLRAESLNSSLIDYANGQHDALDVWTPPEGIEVSQIAGWGADTIAGIDFYTSPAVSALTALAPVRAYRPIFTEDGDGVVPIPSALMMSTNDNVKRYWVDLHSYNKISPAQRGHKDIFEIPSLEAFIKNIIKNGTSTLPAHISSIQPAPITDNKKLTFFLHSPLTLELIDSSGNITGFAEDGSMTQDIPDSSYGEFGEVKYIIVPAGSPYQLTMHGQDNGTFSLDMQESVGGVITASSTLANVPTTASTLASLTISGGLDTVSALTVDEDGDGESEFTITPRLGEIVNYEPPAPEPEPEPEPAPAQSSAVGSPSTSSGSSSGGRRSGGSYPTVAALAANTPATLPVATSTVATGTPESAVPAKIVKAEKKVPAFVTAEVQKPEITTQPEKVGPNVSQTASVYDASQQPLFTRMAKAVYNGLHELWLALKRLF